MTPESVRFGMNGKLGPNVQKPAVRDFAIDPAPVNTVSRGRQDVKGAMKKLLSVPILPVRF